jgi:hypothetical protein
VTGVVNKILDFGSVAGLKFVLVLLPRTKPVFLLSLPRMIFIRNILDRNMDLVTGAFNTSLRLDTFTATEKCIDLQLLYKKSAHFHNWYMCEDHFHLEDRAK